MTVPADVAHEGIRKILNLLLEEDVKQLAITTTQNSLNPNIIKNKADAIEIIIRYSKDYLTILNRKCVKRETLFQYLHDKNITVIPPVTKLSLIQNILEYWNTNSNIIQNLCDDDNEKSNTSTNNEEEINTMAFKFTEWFYGMLNGNEGIGEEHFWNDCSLQIKMSSPDNNVENLVENDRARVADTLYQTRLQHNLFFNPNLTSDGVFGKMNRHGLVLIFVCGTLHTRENCVGTFEQLFSLARDPFSENYWKIKNSKLNLVSKSVAETPKLCESGLSNELLLSLTE